MLNPETISFIVTVAGVALVGTGSLPAFYDLITRLRLPSWKKQNASRSGNVGNGAVSNGGGEYRLLGDLYRDDDGQATEESSNGFSDRVHRILVSILSATGLLLSIALGVIVTLSSTSRLSSSPPYSTLLLQQWLQLGIWVFLCLQSVALVSQPSSTRRFTLGLYNAISNTILVAVICTVSYVFRSRNDSVCAVTLVWIQIATSASLGLVCLLLPRRPDVFRNGKPVDQQYTVSFLSRITFMWANPLLNFAARNKQLSVDDLPEIDHLTRSKYLRETFEERIKTSRRVWKTIVMAHLPSLIVQSILVTVSSFLNFAPQLALLGILRELESRSQGSWVPSRAWTWVFGLGGSMFLQAIIEGWVFWIVFSKLATPVQEQLSAVIFSKAMRRKDVRGTSKAGEDEGDTDPPSSETEPATKNDDEEEVGDPNLQKTHQSTLNLVAIDAKRVADFAAFNYVAYTTVLELAIAFVFLARLIGWKSLLAGALASALVTPVNAYLSGKYTTAQTAQMKYRDQKMAIVTEALQGIRQIKFSALEKQWEDKIRAVRTLELDKQWNVFFYDIGLITIWILNPLMLSAVSLAVYAWLNGGLSASVAFTTMSIFMAIEVTVSILPELIADFLEAVVSATRIEKFLNAPEKLATTVPSDSISFKDATVAWPSDDEENVEDRFALQNVNLQFPNKALSVISGKTGSGKSLLLASLLGECDILEGTVEVPEAPLVDERFDDLATKGNWIIDSAIAFVAQIPWIENASIRDNILFGLPYDQDRYRKVLFACSLRKDLEMLPDGELTDIGANGINLSGGQKWRISFARALYSRAGILVMDDLFSALDAHTGRHLYEHAIMGELCQGRTRILVTHHVSLALPRTDYLVVLEDGGVKLAGSVDELSPHISDVLAETGGDNEEAAAEDTELTEDGGNLKKILSNKSRRRSSVVNGDADATKREVPKKFIEDEQRETGAIDLAVYKEYIKKSGGPLVMGLIFLVYAIFTGLVLGRSWWLKIWTGEGSQSPVGQNYVVANQVHFKASAAKRESNGSENLAYYLGVYVGISIIACIVGSFRTYLVLSASIRASRHLFNNLTYAILRAPLRWLDTVPVGRILNRFTADFLLVDSKLAYDFGFFLWNVFEILGIIIVSILVSPVLIVLAALLLAACMWYSLRYLAGAREIKRLESNAKSPIFEQFGSALTGLATIRAFGKGSVYIDRMHANIDRHAQASWHLWLFNRWMSFRMNVMGAIFTAVTGIVVVAVTGIDASLAGFALSFSVQYSSVISWALRQYANIEMEMNATERVVEYSNIKIENQEGNPVPAAWPTDGRIEVNDLVVGYAPDLPAVLKGLTFSVESNQRVGVVGRTGAGKSSLTLALFRFLEAREGTIYIDGIDVSKIKLHDLRSRLAIIPQDPVLFSGTVRSNLDPFDEYTDEELNDALERVHLTTSDDSEAIRNGTHTPPSSTSTSPTRGAKNKNIFSSLSSTVSEAGLNLSQGQRQLLCLARAIVSRPKIMVLDEATSAVDMSTDALIQRSIRAEFGGEGGSTLLVIAHRLSTIADFDRILVMDAGRAVEFGPPRELMGIEGGVFRSLVEESGERRVLEDIIFGGDGT
ncbi:hypothetical protein FQN54_005965 [Arachnomyces sp. PD_36]|nr:hypothetical protein FQN54_005965 [Arachnomyces sp. PD_36]